MRIAAYINVLVSAKLLTISFIPAAISIMV